MMKQIAEVLTLVGIVAAIANIVAFALIRPHLQGSQAKPALVSWGYTGVGLALGGWAIGSPAGSLRRLGPSPKVWRRWLSCWAWRPGDTALLRIGSKLNPRRMCHGSFLSWLLQR